MKRLFKNYRLSVLTAFGGYLLLLGCTNSDYDFKKVDCTLGFGDGQLTLPSNNSINVTLDDILNLGSTDLIKVDETTGDYVFGKDPESVSPVNVSIDPITLDADKSQSYAFSFNLPTEVMSLPEGTTVDCSILPADVQALLTPKADVYKMGYEFSVPSEVTALDYVEIGGDNGVSLRLTLNMPTLVSESELEIDLPDVLDIPSGVEAGNIVKVTNLSGSKVINLTIKGIKLSPKESASADDYAYLENGKFKMLGHVYLTLKINKLVVPASSEVNVGATVAIDAITITKVTGKFKPTIDAQQVGSTTVNSLPDFLTDARVVADIYNPQIWLDIESNLPLGGIVEAKLGSSTLNGFVELSKAKGNALFIGANTTTKIVVCRKAPAELTGYTAVIADDLSNIVKKLSEGMKITIDITKFEADESKTTIQLGHDYTFKPNYKIRAFLALGDEAVIVYNDKESNWNKDIKDLQLSNGSKAILTANVENGVPADLEIDVEPLDKNGQRLTELVVKPIKNTAAAGVTANQIEYEITDPNGNGLKQLDGINYILNVTAPSAADQKGKALNKNQKITLKDIKLQLNGHVVVDAN